MSEDAKTLIATAVRNFLEEVPTLAPMNLVVNVDLRGGRNDLQQFRPEPPAIEVTKGAAHDAKVSVDMRREFLNVMAPEAKLIDWRGAVLEGKVKATGVEQYLKLIQNVCEKTFERQRLRKARS